jgi:hypothetical protein
MYTFFWSLTAEVWDYIVITEAAIWSEKPVNKA